MTTTQHLCLKCQNAHLVTQREYNVVGTAQHSQYLRPLPNHWMLKCHTFVSHVFHNTAIKRLVLNYFTQACITFPKFWSV